MATHLQHSSPNKRPKTLAPNSQSPPSSISKGKSKLEEESPPPVAENESADCCGICFSEAGVSRGHIDCCNHYYCFICIMEWAKVESKCPLCKRRFSTIRRPPKPPIFASERVVHVPIRDQIYNHFGNATIGPPDLYSEVKCGACQGISDENLLLLCDLCDSASHTYCVGLGYTVPEGDWFCQDCTLLRDEHLKSESNIDSDVQTSSSPVFKISTNQHISVSDVVQESRDHAVRRTDSATSDLCFSPIPASSDDVAVPINNLKRLSSTSLEIIAQHPPKPNARTLRHCRNLHDRIRVLRNNWNGFRTGVLRFSSNPGESNISKKILTVRSGEYSVSRLNQQSTAQCSSSDIKNDTIDHDIQKAWEMFDKAKLARQDRERSNIVCQASKFQIRRLNPVKNANYAGNRQVSLDTAAKNVGSVGAVDRRYYYFEKDCYGQPSSSSGIGMSKSHVAKDVTYCSEGSPTHQNLRSSKGTISHLLHDAANTRNVKLPAKETLKRPHCLGSDASGQVVSNIDHAKGDNHMSSSQGKVKHTKEIRKSGKIDVESQQYNDAKSEIQSLVKLNLKLQTKGEKLEVDAFKEVARLATHSILAACGMEHPRPGFSLIPFPEETDIEKPMISDSGLFIRFDTH